MSRGIAVLLQGNHADLFASLRALEIAKRIGGEVHAMVVESPGHLGQNGTSATGELLELLAWLGDLDGIKITCHRLAENGTDENMIALLIQCRISCLVMGAKSKTAVRTLRHRATRLRRRLNTEQRWYYRSFWTLVTEPWDQETFNRILNRLQRHQACCSGEGRCRPDYLIFH